MEDEKVSYSPVRHENTAVIEGLRSLYNNYNERQRISFIDYLSEWALGYPEEKGIVEIIRAKIDNNLGERLGFFSIVERLVEKSIERPEDFMLNLFGEEEWKNFAIRLVKRNPLDILSIKGLIENEMNKEKGSDKGRHYKKT